MRRLESFLVGKQGLHLKFRPEINSFQRRLVHDVAESLGLQHTSLGEKADRFITISLPGVPPPTLRFRFGDSRGTGGACIAYS